MAKIGMLHPVWAPLSSEANNTITYGTGCVLGRAVSANLQWQRDDGALYGDDIVAETDNSITGYTIDTTTTEMVESVEDMVLGYEEDGSSDEHEITSDPAPYGGHGYVQVLKRHGVRLYKAIWYWKLQFGVQSEDTQTKGQSTNWGTPAVHGVGMGVYNDQSGKAKFRKHKVFNTAAAAIAWLDAMANIT